MIQVAVDLSGIDVMIRNLRDSEAVAERELADAVEDVLQEAREIAATYPAPLPNQVYVRTYDLQAGWMTGMPLTSRTGDTVTMNVRNLVPYSGEVQGEGDQLPIFDNRWKTDAEIMQQVQPFADAEADRAAARIARAIEGRP